MPYDVFISHSSRDKAIADAVCARLEAHGIRCWIAPRDIMPGSDWSEAIVEAITQSRVLALIFSSRSNDSAQVRREVQRASEHGVPIMALRLESVPPHPALDYYLGSEFGLDATSGVTESHLEKLACDIAQLLSLPYSPLPTRSDPLSGTLPASSAISAPASQTLSRPRHNLPLQPTSFVGREREMEEVRQLLAASSLLTLIGSGGCGKTRLAHQVASDLVDSYPDGVWLVELDSLSDPELVPQSVASALGVREEQGWKPSAEGALVQRSDRFPSLPQILVQYLQPKRVLLVLDNCEHLLDACARLVDTLTRGCPHLQILATSRERLGVPGEQVYRIPSLSLPDLHRCAKEEPSALLQCDSVRLFVERATRHQPSFSLTAQNAPTVAAICHRLDGIPLAIELAAARVRAMTVERILERLNDRFQLLTGGSRSALPRQQTLRALIDWSYDLLTGPERTLLHRLSVFAGGWTLEAAEAVTGDDGSDRSSAPPPLHSSDVLDLLTSLVEKSLVVYEEQEPECRYHFLETIRQYARDRLIESGEGMEVQRRHRDFYLRLVEEAAPHLSGPDQEAWFARLEQEHDNLRAALVWTRNDPAGGEAGLRMAGALQRFWNIQGYLREGRDRIAAALAHPRAQEPTAARALALNGAGNLSRNLGDYAAARAFHEEALAIRRTLGDKKGIAGSLANLGILADVVSDYARARSLLEEALTLIQEQGDRDWEARILYNLGNACFHLGEYDAARRLYEQARQLHRAMGYKMGVKFALYGLGQTACQQNRLEEARALYGESLALCRELNDPLGAAFALEGLAQVIMQQGQPERTARLLGAADALRESLGAPLPPASRAEYDACKQAARSALGEGAYDAVFREGRAMTMERAIDYALEKGDSE